MGRGLATLRFMLQSTWLLPALWLFSRTWTQGPGPLLTPLVFVGFGLIILTVRGLLPRSWTGKRAVLLDASSFGLVVALSGVVIFAAAHFGMPTKAVDIIVNWIALVIVGALPLRVLSQETTLDNTFRSFRFGMFAMMFIMTSGYFAEKHLNGLGPHTYLSAIGYAMLGILSLAAVQRYSIGRDGRDERRRSIESDWLLSMVLLVGVLGIIGFMLAQLFAFDFIGALGRQLTPVQSSITNGETTAFKAALNAVRGLLNLIGIHPSHPRTPKEAPFPKHRKLPKANLDYGQENRVVVEILKVLALVFGGIIGLVVLVILLRKVSGQRGPQLAGEVRESRWSLAAMLRWLLRRSKEEIAALIPPMPHIPRPTRLRSVRDVYRAFLGVGRAHGHPRARSQTGLEYSHVFTAKFSESQAPLLELNELYIRERYGGRAVTQEALATAQADLKRIEASTKAATG